VRRVRYLCGLRSLDLNCTVDQRDNSIRADASDALDPLGPRTNIHVDLSGRGILISRFDKRADVSPAARFKFIFRKFIEFTPRAGFDTDTDFRDNGFDPMKDTTVNDYDLNTINQTTVEPLHDFGSNDINNDPNRPIDQQQGSGFQRVFRLSVRFGPLRLIRLILTFVLSNVRNSAGLGQVNIPGGINFNAVFDNIPFTRDGTHFAFAYDIDSDVDVTVNRKLAQTENDADVPKYPDDAETVLDFSGVNDTRRVRFRRIVFCENGNTLIIRERVVVIQDNGVTFRRVYITYFFSNQRCARLFFDPALDNAPPDQPIAAVPPQTSQQGGPSSAGGSGNASFVCFSAILLFILSLLF